MKHLLALIFVATFSITNTNNAMAQADVMDSLALIDLYISTNQPPEYHVGEVKNWWGIYYLDAIIKGNFVSRQKFI